MWSWVLHRITGVAIFFFLLVHVLDTALIRVSPEAYNAVIGTYKNPIMGIGEVALVGAIAYHAYNGLRIILVDFWSWATRHQRQLWWGVIGLWLVTMLAFTPRHLMNVFADDGRRSLMTAASHRRSAQSPHRTAAARARTSRSGAGSTCASRACCWSS